MTTTIPQPRNIEQQRVVVGSGGRVRTVNICEFGCWHGSRSQALKCKSALRLVAKQLSQRQEGTK